MVSPEVCDIFLRSYRLLSLLPFPPAFSEHVPVVHIVGTPNTLQLETKPMLHHTLGDGRFVDSIPILVLARPLTPYVDLTRTSKPPSRLLFLRHPSPKKSVRTSI